MREGIKFGDVTLVDSMLKDGLMDVFNNYHMGITGPPFLYRQTDQCSMQVF